MVMVICLLQRPRVAMSAWFGPCVLLVVQRGLRVCDRHHCLSLWTEMEYRAMHARDWAEGGVRLSSSLPLAQIRPAAMSAVWSLSGSLSWVRPHDPYGADTR